MLTGSLLLTRIQGNEVIPLFLDPGEPRVIAHAEAMIEHHRELARRVPAPRRREIRESIAPLLLGPGNLKVWEGMAHILEKRCDFAQGDSSVHETFRLSAFEKAARARALDQFCRTAILQETATECDLPTESAEDWLFGDLPIEQPLISFQGLTAQALIAWYNIGLVQGILLESVGIRAEADHPGPAGLRELARRATFHRLLCQFGRSPEGNLRLVVDGPLSLFGPSHRYGFQLACFFPALLDLKNWSLHSKLFFGRKKLAKTLTLGSDCGLSWPESKPCPQEEAVADLLQRNTEAAVPGWDLLTQDEPIPLANSYWVPALSAVRQADGARVLIDLPGAWRAKNLQSLRAKIARNRIGPVLFCLKESHCLGEKGTAESDPAIYLYKKSPLLGEIMKRAQILLEKG